MPNYNVLFLCTGNSARSMLSLPLASLDALALKSELGNIGKK